MANSTNVLRRYVLRRDFFRKLNEKYRYYMRYGTRDAFNEQVKAFSNVHVKTIFDVGANEGETVSIYLRSFRDATIYAFEPTPPVLDRLAVRFQRVDRVQIFPFAVGESDGDVVLHVSEVHPNMNSTLLPNSRNWMGETADATVKMISMNSFCSTYNVPEVHILKLDIQGGELAALRGASDLLTSERIWSVYMECQIQPLYKEQPLIDEILGSMRGYGFDLFNFYNFRETKHGQARWCDALFISSKLASSVRLHQ